MEVGGDGTEGIVPLHSNLSSTPRPDVTQPLVEGSIYSV